MLTKLLKIEARKNFYYRAFWILSILYFILMGIVLYGINSFTLKLSTGSESNSEYNFSSLGIFQFPDIWQWITYTAGFFVLIPATLIILNICNEFEYRTIRQNLIDGLSRAEFLISKVITAFIIALTSTLFVFFLILILGFSFSATTDPVSVWERSEFIAAYFLQLLTYLLAVILLAMVIRKAALSIGILLLYSLVVEPIIAYKFTSLSPYLPVAAIGNLIHSPFYKIAGESLQDGLAARDMLIVILYLFLFPAIAFLFLRKRDI